MRCHCAECNPCDCVVIASLRHFFIASLRCRCIIALSLRHCIFDASFLPLRCHCVIASFWHCCVIALRRYHFGIALYHFGSAWLRRAKTKGTARKRRQEAPPGSVARSGGRVCLPFAQHPYIPGGATRCRWPINVTYDDVMMS